MALQRPVARHAAGDLAHVFGRGPRALRRSWTLATVVGETLGFLVPGVIAVWAFDLHPVLTLVVMVLAGSLEGAVLGFAQSVVLGREFLGFSRIAWTAATATGAAAAWLLGMLPATTYPLWQDWPTAATVPAGVVLGLGLLGTIGLAQWTVLRHHVSRSRTWVPANAVAWALGLGVLLAIATPLWHEGQSRAAVLGIAALGGLAMAVTVAALTGRWLGRLVQPRPLAESRPAPAGVPPLDWAALSRPTDRYRVFDPADVDDLPEPVQRWVRHAILPGATLLTGVELETTGHIRLGRSWRPFCSRHRATLHDGFLWAARARVRGIPVVGYDRLTHGEGEMTWRLARLVSVASGAGEPITRSAAGRHAAELLAAVPAVALDPAVQWQAVDHGTATAYVPVDGTTQAVTVTVDPVGRLRQVEMDRWGAPPGSRYDRYRFGALLGEERRFDGYLVPTEVLAGWHIGTGRWDEGAFLRSRVLRCSFH